MEHNLFPSVSAYCYTCGMKNQPTFTQSIIKRVLVYTTMTIAVIGFSTLMLMLLLGYRFNETKARLSKVD